MSDQSLRPIIIKRKVVKAAGHHGGAWKVAYADFVTAMMAFFLLMWLLGATNENQRKGIADFFNPSIPINKVSGGGEGAFGGETVFAEDTKAQNGTGAEMIRPSDSDQAKGSTGIQSQPDKDNLTKRDSALFADLKKKLVGSGGESMVSDRLRRHVITRLTDEGFVVEIYDLPNAPLFLDQGTPSQRLDDIVTAVSRVFDIAANRVAVRGHVPATPSVTRLNTSWVTSTEKAVVVREILEAKGTSASRIMRVEGHADRQPSHPNRLHIRNNRIEIVLLRSTK